MIFTERATWGEMRPILIKKLHEYHGEFIDPKAKIGGVEARELQMMPEDQLFSDKTVPDLAVDESLDEEEDD